MIHIKYCIPSIRFPVPRYQEFDIAIFAKAYYNTYINCFFIRGFFAMKKNSIYTDVGNNVLNDAISEFLTSLNIEPKKFGHSHDAPGGGCDDRIIGEFEVICMVSGKNYVTIGNEHFETVAGDVVWIPPYVKHSMRSSEQDPCNNFWIHFDVSSFIHARQLQNFLKDGQQCYTKLSLDSEVFSIFRYWESHFNQNLPGGKLYAKTATLQILLLIFLSYGDNFPGQVFSSKLQSNLVLNATAYIQKNIRQPCTVSQICQALHVSQSTLFKAFAKELKLTPNELVTLYKLKTAEQMLKTTEASITEIAAYCGFTSPFYFSNVFKKVYGKSPRAYMRSEGLS